MAEQNTLFNRIPRQPLREIAYTAIREAILRRELKPGQRLVEAEIARQMGISRAPVREALRQLEAEGLVVSEPHRGAFVAQFTSKDMWEVYTLRAILERLATTLATRSAGEETIARLNQLVGNMETAVRENDIPRLVELDMAFHECLCRASGHARLLKIWLSMAAQIRMFMDLVPTVYISPEEVVTYHTQVLKLIRQGQAEQAGETLYHHIMDAGRVICQQEATPLKASRADR